MVIKKFTRKQIDEEEKLIKQQGKDILEDFIDTCKGEPPRILEEHIFP